MKKDKDWLSEQVGDLNSTHAVFNEGGVSYIDTVVSMERVYELINQLDEPEILSWELPVIPKFVADWIEEQKEVESNLWHVMNNVSIQRNDNPQLWTWIWRNDNVDKFAKAWLDGYEVEKEPLFYVMKDGVVILSKRYRDYDSHESHWIGTVTNKEYIKENPDKVRFTEQEIKDFDERFWSFAVLVEEIEE